MEKREELGGRKGGRKGERETFSEALKKGRRGGGRWDDGRKREAGRVLEATPTSVIGLKLSKTMFIALYPYTGLNRSEIVQFGVFNMSALLSHTTSMYPTWPKSRGSCMFTWVQATFSRSIFSFLLYRK